MSCRRLLFKFGIIALVLMVLWGCYPKHIGPAGPDGDRLTWSEMNLEQRKEHMATFILPIATTVFGAMRPGRFDQADCGLCHSEVPGKAFDMPTDHLPRLSGKLLLGPEFEKYPDAVRIKLDRLVPEMAGALGMRKFSLITRSGFGCYSCHLGPDGPVFGN